MADTTGKKKSNAGVLLALGFIVLATPIAACGIGQWLNGAFPAAAWRFSQTKPDPMTDAVTYIASRRAEGSRDEVLIQCRSGDTPVLIAAPQARAGQASTVNMRFDAEEPESRGAFYYDGGAVGITIDSVMSGRLGAAKRLAIEYSALSGPDRALVVPLEGFAEAHARIVAECAR